MSLLKAFHASLSLESIIFHTFFTGRPDLYYSSKKLMFEIFDFVYLVTTKRIKYFLIVLLYTLFNIYVTFITHDKAIVLMIF